MGALPSMQSIPGFDALPWRTRSRVRLLAFLQRAVNRHPRLARTGMELLPEAMTQIARRSTAPLRVRTASARLDPDSIVVSARIQPSDAPRVSIVVPTHSALSWLRACLSALAEHAADVPQEVIVVDDGSPEPEAVARIVSDHPAVTLLRNPSSLGFAAAVNRGASKARGDVLVVLNDDTLVTPSWLAKLLAVLDSDERIAWVGPATNDSGDAATTIASYRTYPELLAFAAHAAGAPQDVDKLALFCAAIRRSHFEAVGGVDEGYGRGLFEDDDLCMKLSRAGHRIVLVPEVFVHHAAGATFRQLDPLEYLARFEVNRRRFERRWRRRWRAP